MARKVFKHSIDDGSLICTYDSMYEAARKEGIHIKNSSFHNACKDKCEYNGALWSIDYPLMNTNTVKINL